MPYYLHTIGASPDPETDPSYDTKPAALADRTSDQTVSFVPTDDERQAWQRREWDRLVSGYYRPVPWENESWYRRDPHFPHLSTDEPGKIAYTPSDEHGIRDKQTRVRPGKYLQEFHATDLSADEIQKWASLVTARSQSSLQLATSAEEIRSVYMHGPSSCMSKGPNHYATGGIHPCEVYGDSDLAVAYLGDLDRVSARAIVWPAEKVYRRVYGDVTALEHVLQDHGYKYGNFENARVRAIKIRSDLYVMPYVDGISAADKDGGYFILGDGDYETDNTNGTTSANASLELCHRDGCTNHVPDEDSTYCEDCDSERFMCDACYEDGFGDDYVRIGGHTYCEDCAVQYRCENHNECGNYRYTREETYCRDCERSRSFCDACEEDVFGQTMQDVDGIGSCCKDCAPDHKHTCASCNDTWYEKTDEEPDLCATCADYQTVCQTCETVTTIAPHCAACGERVDAYRCPVTLTLPLDDYEESHAAIA